jgi:hypothetical protein
MSIIPFCWCHCRKYLLNIIKEVVMEENNKQNDTQDIQKSNSKLTHKSNITNVLYVVFIHSN